MCKNAGDTQRYVSIHPIDPKLPDPPTGSPRWHAELPDGLKSHATTLNMRRHAHGNVDGSNTPENVSVTPDLLAKGAASCMGEPEGPQDKTDASDTCTYAWSTVSDSKTPENALEYVRVPSNMLKTLTHLVKAEELGNPSGVTDMRKTDPKNAESTSIPPNRQKNTKFT